MQNVENKLRPPHMYVTDPKIGCRPVLVAAKIMDSPVHYRNLKINDIASRFSASKQESGMKMAN